MKPYYIKTNLTWCSLYFQYTEFDKKELCVEARIGTWLHSKLLKNLTYWL